jgi:hypothetical protein
MSESVRERYGRWKVEELFLRHPRLHIVPTATEDLVLRGDVEFCVRVTEHEVVEDTYALEVRVPMDFPAEVPTVRETSGRIQEDYHKLEGDFLCLGAPTELRLRLAVASTLPEFVDAAVIPYLFGYTYFLKHGTPPFGELSHGSKGIIENLAELFHAPPSVAVVGFLWLASLKRRIANKRLCPCRSGWRLARCHNRKVNELRDRLGRRWFRCEYARVTNHLEQLQRPPRLRPNSGTQISLSTVDRKLWDGPATEPDSP